MLVSVIREVTELKSQVADLLTRSAEAGPVVGSLLKSGSHLGPQIRTLRIRSPLTLALDKTLMFISSGHSPIREVSGRTNKSHIVSS